VASGGGEGILAEMGLVGGEKRQDYSLIRIGCCEVALVWTERKK